MYKFIIALGLVGVCSFVPLKVNVHTVKADQLQVIYVGSIKSNKYHYQYCKWARKINRANLVVFNSPTEALSQGYVPCKVCKPPRE